jgi:hypothetical protein
VCERSRGLGRRIHGSVEDTKLSTNKQHSLSMHQSLDILVLLDGSPTSSTASRRPPLPPRRSRRPPRRPLAPQTPEPTEPIIVTAFLQFLVDVIDNGSTGPGADPVYPPPLI